MYPNNNTNGNRTDIGDAIDFARRVAEPKIVTTADGVPALLGTDGNGRAALLSIKPIVDEWRNAPARRKGTISVTDLDTFVALVNRDKREQSAIFAAKGDAPSLVAVLDFHKPADSGPSFCEDRIKYAFPFSDEWKTWAGSSGADRAMNQESFAQFVDDNLQDIGEPGNEGKIAADFAAKRKVKFADPVEMISLARGLEIRKGTIAKEVRNAATGEVDLVYGETHHARDASGAVITVPAAFFVEIPIFEGGKRYSIAARLRYRVPESKPVMWWYELHAVNVYRDAAIDEAIARVRMPAPKPDGLATEGGSPGGCGLPVYMGSPP